MQSTFTQNHFELFGLPVSFDIDLTELSERYRELQRAVHPDKFASASDQERRLSVQYAAQINEAFQTLKTPLARARYLLSLHDINIDEETDTAMDPSFLMEQIELRECLGEIRHSDDPHGQLNSLMQDIEQRMNALIQEFRQQIQTGDNESLAQARDTARKMQFIDKLRDEAEQLEEELL